MKRTIIASIALLLAMVANAGPFGYEMGQKIDGEPDGFASDAGVTFKFMPDPPAPFRDVLAFYTEETGVCAVRGNIDIVNYRRDRLGVEHRERADWLAGEIEAKYGEPGLLIDELNDDAFWSEPHWWLKSIENNERKYGYEWLFFGLLDNIWRIKIGIEYGSVNLIYHFVNTDQCTDQLRDSL